MRNERTSKRVAKIAGEILAIAKSKTGWYRFDEKSMQKLRALAASCLTQAPDRSHGGYWIGPKREAIEMDPVSVARGHGKRKPKRVTKKQAMANLKKLMNSPSPWDKPKRKAKKRASSPMYPASKPKRSSP